MSDVFISYSREDRDTAQLLARDLELSGYAVWWDRELLSGVDFERAISHELSTASAVVVLWSATSVQSGWVKDEASTAMERGVLVPVLLNGTMPPLGFRSLHCIKLNQGDLSELKRALVRLITRPVVPVVTAAPRALGIGLVEVACFVLLATAFGLFIWLTPR